MNQRTQKIVDERARRELSDTRWDAVRTPRARQVLVVAFGASLAVVAITYLVAGPWGLATLPVSALTVFLLRRSVRTVADLPDEHLDERLISRRDRSYLFAYRLLGCLALSALVVMSLVADHHRLDFYDLSAVFWPVCLGAIGFPSAVLAWTAPPESFTDEAVAQVV